MAAHKKTARKRTYKGAHRKKTSNLKILLAPFLVIVGIVVLLSGTILKSNNIQGIASDGEWQEVISSPSAGFAPQGGGVIPQNITTLTKTSQAVSNTGLWNGRQVQVVKDAGFSDVFKSSGIYSINALDDERVFMGGNAGFAILSPAGWSNLSEYKVTNIVAQSKVGVVTNIVPTLSNGNSTVPEVYMQTTKGVLRYTVEYDVNGNTSLVADPTDPLGYLRDATLVSYANSTGVVAYKPTSLYFLDRGAMRKWNTPLRQCGFQNLQDQLMTAYYDQNAKKTYFFIKECQNVYLYDINLDIAVSVPLTATKLSRITNFPTQLGIFQTQVGNSTSNTLFMVKKFGVMWVIKNYNPTSLEMSFDTVNPPPSITTTELGTINYAYNTFDLDRSTNTVWANPAVDNQAWFTGNNLASAATYVFGTNSLAANTYTNAITVNEKNSVVYIAHKYLPGQFNSGLVTIIGNKPSSSPTPQKKCPAKLGYVRTTNVCAPTKLGNSKTMSFGCSDGYVGTQKGTICRSTADWYNLAKRECAIRMTTCN